MPKVWTNKFNFTWDFCLLWSKGFVGEASKTNLTSILNNRNEIQSHPPSCATWGYPNVSLHREQQAGFFFQTSEYNNPDQSLGYTPMPYLYWLWHDSKTYSHHTDCKYSEMYCFLPSVAFAADEFKSAVLCIVLAHSNVTAPRIAENSTFLDSCMGKPSGTLMMLVNNISHNSGFRWKVLIMS